MPATAATCSISETAADRWNTLCPPCPDCGNPHTRTWTESECEEMLVRDARLDADAPEMRQTIMGWLPRVLCPACYTRWRFQDAAQKRKAAREMVVRRAYREGWMPREMERWSFDSGASICEARNPAAFATCKGAPLAHSLWIRSHPGRGKSVLAAMLANNHLQHGISVGWLDTMSVINPAAQRYEPQQGMAKWMQPDVLVIDDLDKLDVTEKAVKLVWWLVDGRKGKPVVVTANKTGAALSAALKERVDHATVASLFSRFMPVTAIELEGPDLRAVPPAPAQTQQTSAPQPVAAAQIEEPEEAELLF